MATSCYQMKLPYIIKPKNQQTDTLVNKQGWPTTENFVICRRQNQVSIHYAFHLQTYAL